MTDKRQNDDERLAAYLGGEMNEEDRRRFEAAMAEDTALADEVHRLPVQTIHSFCHRLLRAFPLEAGLHPSFEVDADGSRVEHLVEEVVEAALRSEGRGDEWHRLAGSGIGPLRVAEALQGLVRSGATPGELRPYYALDTKDISEGERRDGVGDFYRTYVAGETVTVTAPEIYGNYRLKAWVGREDGREPNDPVLGVSLNNPPYPAGLYLHTVEAEYEYVGPLPGPTDFNKDFYVDWTDYSALSSAWHTVPGDAKWDAECDVSEPPDDVIDMLDFAAFVDSWLTWPE